MWNRPGSSHYGCGDNNKYTVGGNGWGVPVNVFSPSGDGLGEHRTEYPAAQLTQDTEHLQVVAHGYTVQFQEEDKCRRRS